MTTPARLAANRQNALRSTGPKTLAGKARTAANAFSSRLYTRLAVIPALGETPDAWAAFVQSVARDLGAEGPVELSLAEQVAGLLWRLRRLRAAEGAAFTPAGVNLPPDPDTISADAEDPSFRLPPNAGPARRLAHTRATIRTLKAAVARTEVGAAVMAGPGPRDGEMDWLVAHEVELAVGDELGRAGPTRRLHEASRALGEDPAKAAWTAEFTRRVVAAAGAAAGRVEAAFAAAVAARLNEGTRELAARLATLEAEERELAAGLSADRARAAAAAALADEGLLARVAKVEAHLGRELQRVLGLLDQVRASRAAAVGFVPTSSGVLRGVEEPRVLPIREERG